MVRVRLRDRNRFRVLKIEVGFRLSLALGPLSTVIFTLILMIRKRKLLTRE